MGSVGRVRARTRRRREPPIASPEDEIAIEDTRQLTEPQEATTWQAIVGEEQRKRDLMERLLRIASPLGLYAYEYDVETGRHLGNMPQVVSHLALIEAAGRIILGERVAEL
jgi:hypothetical protein